ncbi:MAG TPA: tetratricopeptide repeat protein [Pyrinomonadaceae bacterium]|nr:tetratricopeptide repeat protein [Pyrinomonadaceae bacterium]
MKLLVCFAALLALLLSPLRVSAQTGDHTLYGDLTVDESNANGLKPLTFDVILYSESNVLIARQPTPNNGRFRFNNLSVGVYLLVIEVENTEVARVSVDLRSPMLRDVRRDISLEWRLPGGSTKPGVIPVNDSYNRAAATRKLFQSALKAKERKQYAKASELLRQIIQTDAKDFQAWFELANIHFLVKKLEEAENEYLRAIDAHPGFFPALLNLGRLELFQKRYDVAIEVLRQAVKAGPEVADASYFLGEAYLQNKRGSFAVLCFKEALRLDPQGMAEVHLRLALLYDRAGMKDKAALEYQEFLKKKPDYQDRKKLEQYISANKK